MRDIKFRGWDKKNKRMERVSYFDFDKKGRIGFVDLVKDFEKPFSEIILMQSTGLKDEKGKEIYEGDILNNCGDNFYSVVEYRTDLDTPGFYAIERKPKYARAKHYNKKDGRIHFIPALTVLPIIVGNIYENPELLNK